MTESHCSSGDGRPVNSGRPRTPRIDIEHLKATVTVEEVARYFCDGEGRPQGNVAMFLCPFHDDTNPSLRVPLSGQYAGTYRCFACGAAGSSSIDFVCDVKGIPRHSAGPAIRWLADQFGGREESPSTINRKAPPRPPKPKDPTDFDRRAEFNKAKRLPFKRNTQYRSQLVNDRKWNDGPPDRFSRIEQFGIELVERPTYDPVTGTWRDEVRYRFPFYYRGRVCAWQDRAAGETTAGKWLTSRGGVPVPYNVDRLTSDAPAIVICEGPADVVTFEELKGTFTPGKFPVVLGFPGASMTKPMWMKALRDDGRPILLLVDNDDRGEAMRQKFIDELGDQVRQTVRVPDEHNDFGDWWTAVGHADLEERARFVKMIETEGDHHGNP